MTSVQLVGRPAASVSPPTAVAHYDPDTGSYIGPDGKTYTHSDRARGSGQPHTWQDLLVPPKGQ